MITIDRVKRVVEVLINDVAIQNDDETFFKDQLIEVLLKDGTKHIGRLECLDEITQSFVLVGLQPKSEFNCTFNIALSDLESIKSWEK